MNEKLERWIVHVEAVRPHMDELAKRLEPAGAIVEPEVTNVVGELTYIARFPWPEQDAVTTLRFLLKDHQTDSDVVITNLTTLPEQKRGNGLGSQAVQRLLQWAADNYLNEVRATQVGPENESFWRKNGFEKCPAPNPCNDFVHRLRNDRRETP